jgi:hypothetical protein
MSQSIKMSDFLGSQVEEDFLSFDMTEIQEVLAKLKETDPIDLAHAELLQQQALRGADILVEYLGKIVKTVGYLEAKVSNVKNKAALEYKAPDGARTTIDMRKFAAEASPEVEAAQIKLARAKATKLVLERKFDLLVRSHHYYKDLTAGLRRTILGYPVSSINIPEGYE